MIRLFIFLVVVMGFQSAAFAKLEWESQRIKQVVEDSSGADVFTKIKFKNTGENEVVIKSIKTNCGCTTAKTDKKAYPKGAEGVLEVKFEVGSRVGVQKKLIVLQTNDKLNPLINLEVEYVLPVVVEMSPEKLKWELAETYTPQSVVVKRSKNANPFRIVKATSGNEKFKVDQIAVKEGEEYRIEVLPIEVTRACRVEIRIETDYPKEKPRVFSFWVEVGL